MYVGPTTSSGRSHYPAAHLGPRGYTSASRRRGGGGGGRREIYIVHTGEGAGGRNQAPPWRLSGGPLHGWRGGRGGGGVSVLGVR